MTDQFDKTEKQYIELTSGIQRFEHFSVYTDPFLPQIFSHNFVQLHRTFPLDKLLPFFVRSGHASSQLYSCESVSGARISASSETNSGKAGLRSGR